ncbi:hypothetical protein SAMN04515672_2912 [Natronorubrum texcoconense]|uniref:DUF5786 domain-containing protein n=2 Tax=Natronorubrum texcoconense TaxID=1095776 RepID=A0A1G9BD20_9EURY|nr:hypothetical protein SAMN04515672_2912 [Natronorubrum texcoconense]
MAVTNMCVLTMSMGAYDEEEHERREQQASKVDTDFDDERTIYHGKVEYDSGESAEELLDQFERMKSD